MTVAAHGSSVIRLPVTQTLSGNPLDVVVHDIRGALPGPTIAILAGLHGDEFATMPIVRRFVLGVDTATLRGRILAVPVASSRALAAFSRYNVELHGNTDLHVNFPGNARGTLTQMLGRVITTGVLDVADALVDLHSGGAGGRLQLRVDYDYRVSGDLRERTLKLCRAFGTPLLHENDLSGTASYYCNQRNVPTVNAEVGGQYTDAAATRWFEERGVNGLRSVLTAFGMLDGEAIAPQKQLVYDGKARIEINPQMGGYLESFFDRAELLSQHVERGTLLGRMIDPYTFEVIEELRAPCSGPLFFTRFSGMVEAGSKVFGIADEANATWI